MNVLCILQLDNSFYLSVSCVKGKRGEQTNEWTKPLNEKKKTKLSILWPIRMSMVKNYLKCLIHKRELLDWFQHKKCRKENRITRWWFIVFFPFFVFHHLTAFIPFVLFSTCPFAWKITNNNKITTIELPFQVEITAKTVQFKSHTFYVPLWIQ